jgi:hypothetical protein
VTVAGASLAATGAADAVTTPGRSTVVSRDDCARASAIGAATARRPAMDRAMDDAVDMCVSVGDTRDVGRARDGRGAR